MRIKRRNQCERDTTFIEDVISHETNFKTLKKFFLLPLAIVRPSDVEMPSEMRFDVKTTCETQLVPNSADLGHALVTLNSERV